MRPDRSRNAACPCGSGKKYKDCCHPRNAPRAAPQATPAAPSGNAAPVGPTRSSAAVANDPARAGLGLTAYTITKLTERGATQAKLPPAIRRRVEQDLRDGWTIAKVAALPTDELEAQVRRLGVAHTRDAFLALAAGRTSAWSISDVWLAARRGPLTPADDDFLGLAACELWKRLCPERPSIEMLDDWMQEGYAAMEKRQAKEACALWWRTWQVLRARFTPEMKRMNDTGDVFLGLQSIFNWSQELERELLNASIEDPAFAAMGRQLCEEWIAQFTEDDASMQVSFHRGLASHLMRLGEVDRAEAVLLRNVERWPGDVWGYVALGDAYAHTFAGDEAFPKDVPRAVEWLQRGLAVCGKKARGREVLEQRLAEIRKRG